jgi:type IV secretion system protein VirB10
MRLLLAIAALAAIAAPLVRAGDPNFSGRWQLDANASNTHALPSQPGSTLEVRHDGATVRCRQDPDGAEWTFTTDRKETRSKFGALTLSSIGKWEGAAALINTIVTGPGVSYTQMDRWRVSRDGSRLSIRREIVRPGAAQVREAELVYQRMDLPAVTAAPAAPRKPVEGPSYRIAAGTAVPLTLLNSVSTKQSEAGDRIYLETSFPVLVQGRVVIPPGSYVAGTLTYVKRPGRVKGRGELFLRFDSLTLPNGVTREFRARAGGADADIQGELDRNEGKISSDTNRVEDARTIGEGAAAGASVGAIGGGAAGRPGAGAAIGAGAGAAAGVMSVLLSRGPDIVLSRGASIEMVLDRPLIFTESELTQR